MIQIHSGKSPLGKYRPTITARMMLLSLVKVVASVGRSFHRAKRLRSGSKSSMSQKRHLIVSSSTYSHTNSSSWVKTMNSTSSDKTWSRCSSWSKRWRQMMNDPREITWLCKAITTPTFFWEIATTTRYTIRTHSTKVITAVLTWCDANVLILQWKHRRFAGRATLLITIREDITKLALQVQVKMLKEIAEECWVGVVGQLKTVLCFDHQFFLI